MTQLRSRMFSEENLVRLEAYLRSQGVAFLSREARDAAYREAFAGVADDEDVWVFGYGSLLWNPGCRVAERLPARHDGHERAFCLWNTFGRGTPEKPGLMLALEPGGSCSGAALRIAAAERPSELGFLWTREMLTGAYAPRWVEISTPSGPRRALTFVANPASARYAGRLPRAELVRHLSGGEGPLGTSRGYLASLVHHLDRLGLPDAAMQALLGEVEAITGPVTPDAGIPPP